MITSCVISPQTLDDCKVVDAIDLGARCKVFFDGDPPDRVLTDDSCVLKTIGGHAIVDGPRALFSELKGSKPALETFEDKTVLMGFRISESPKIVKDWIQWHAAHHGAEAALIIDRGPPDARGRFFDELKSIMGATMKGSALVVVAFDHPLGAKGEPPEPHPISAPDAPGKDRMEVPDPDPWTSPLEVRNCLEVLRHRFLANARAVGFLDVSDLAAPIKGTSIFDQALKSAQGMFSLYGKRAYPWRVRNGHAAHFFDHICTQFDNRSGVARWCIAPQKRPQDKLWRPFYTPQAKKGRTRVGAFFRHMALRHPDVAISRIVPKSSLIENQALVAAAKEFWKAKPVPVPEQKLRQGSDGTNSVAIVTCMKNEGPFILEWLAYHRVIGVKNVLVYTNDCTDGTDDFLDLLMAKGLVQHRNNPFRDSGLKPQHAALQAAEDEEIIKASDWLISMDVDEFINVKVGDGHLNDLFAAVPDANMISLTWRLFGNSDVHAFQDQPLIEAYTRCANEITRKPHQAWGFKTLYRNLGIFKKLGVHRPKGLNPQLWDKINWVNGSGRPMPRRDFRNGWRSTLDTVGYDLVSLNHYAVRSAESFLVKRDRGRVNHVDRDQGLAYWFRMNHNVAEDQSIQRMLPKLKAEMARLLDDPEIAAQHEACVSAHRAKIAELMKTPTNAEFFKTLTSPRMERLSRLLPHFGANVFLAGPDVVPDEVVFAEHPETFFYTVEKQETQH